MSDATAAPEDQRRFRLRVGVTLLNLIFPGLGLLRVGDDRGAALFLAAPFALAVLATIGFGHWPITGYRSAVLALALLVGVTAAIILGSMVRTWHRSRWRVPIRGWSRWYGVAAVAVMVIAVAQGVPGGVHRFYKPFDVPSASMAPTLAVGDMVVADMQRHAPPAHGDVIAFEAAHGVRIGRVAAIAGDRIALRAGVPIVNGIAATQVRRGTTHAGFDGTLLDERLPGEKTAHRTIDAGPSPLDDMRAVVVPADRVFVLGDNRDRAADSRLPPARLGAGMVRIAAIVGRPIYIGWSSDRTRIGGHLQDW